MEDHVIQRDLNSEWRVEYRFSWQDGGFGLVLRDVHVYPIGTIPRGGMPSGILRTAGVLQPVRAEAQRVTNTICADGEE